MSKEAEELAEQFGGVWGEHPDYPVSDWQYEVTNNGTRSGYWDWVLSWLEADDLTLPA